MNDIEFYKTGTLLQTRKKIFAWDNSESNRKNILIPYGSILVLLGYKNNFKDEHLFVLYDNKTLYVMNVDIGHDFKILC